MRSLVPDGEGKHAAQVFRAVSAELIVGVNDGFGVAVGVESVAQLFEFLAQLEVVVDLAVEDDPRATIRVVNWLLAALEVDDCEATHREAGRAVDVKAVLIGTAVTDGVVHPRQQLLVNWLTVVPNDPYDSTHK